MAALRATSRRINNKVDVFRLEVALPLSNKAEVIRSRNDFIRPHCERVIALAEKALSLLNEMLK